MTWTFANAPSTQTSQGRRDAVRFMINDLTSGRPLRSDEAIAFALSQEGLSLYRAAAWLCDTLADSEAVALKVGDLALGAEKPANYRAMAANYRWQDAVRAAVPFMVAQSSGAKATAVDDTDRVKPYFARDMMQPVGLPQIATTVSTT